MTLTLIIGAGLIIWTIIIFNRLVRERQRVLTAWSDIDVQLKRRYDLIPKLVAAVDQYARYERSVLETLIALRSRTGQVDDVEQRGVLETRIGGGLRSLMALVEDYPQLKADQSFLHLQTELTEVENHIQYARRFYNGSVRDFNIRIATFPDLLVARLCKYQARPFFELENSAEQHSPEMKL